MVREAIGSLESQLSLLREEERTLNDEVIINCSRTSPIGGVPFELLCNIFELVIHQSPTRIRTLLLVCSHWNSIIMQTPHLWTRVAICGPFYPSISNDFITYYNCAVERSRNMPMDVVFDTKLLLSCYSICANDRFALLDSSDTTPATRCKHYDISCDTAAAHTSTAFDVLKHLLAGDRSNWASFHFHWTSRTSNLYVKGFDRNLFSHFLSAKNNLRHLSFEDPYHDFAPPTLPPPGGLKSLRLWGSNWKVAFHFQELISLELQFNAISDWIILRNTFGADWKGGFPSLRKLSLIRDEELPKDTIVWPKRVPFPLTIGYVTELFLRGRIPAFILEWLDFPILESLTISAKWGESCFMGYAGWHFSKYVRHLYLQCVDLPGNDMREGGGAINNILNTFSVDLRFFTNLKSLEICHCMWVAAECCQSNVSGCSSKSIMHQVWSI